MGNVVHQECGQEVGYTNGFGEVVTVTCRHWREAGSISCECCGHPNRASCTGVHDWHRGQLNWFQGPRKDDE